MAVVTEGVDIVVAVYNGLHHVRQCLRSVRRWTSQPYHLIVVDDGSDPYVADQLSAMLESWWPQGGPTLLTNEENVGYLRSVNRGIEAGRSQDVVLLNSDTLVTPGWLEGLRRCVNSSPEIAIASPLASHANFTRLAFPRGATFLSVAAHVRRLSQRNYPEIGIASGFCFIASRSLYEEIGLFDEIYGRGYYEESDLCMRAYERGYRVVADDATFIYHHGWGSFGAEERNRWMQGNRRIFEMRWGRAHELWHERFTRERPFMYLENALARELSPRRQVAQEVLEPPAEQRPSGTSAFTTRSAASWQRTARRNARRRQRTVGSARPRVLYLLPGIGPWGGIISVAQLVNRLLLRGFDARVATSGAVRASFFREQLFFRPYVFSTRRELLRSLPHHDLVVATRWDTVYDALLLQRRWRSRLAYFVQGFEARYEQEGTVEAEAAWATYGLVRDKIVKSGWLEEELSRFGGRIHRVPLGLNLDVFYPASTLPSEPPWRVVTAARPGVEVRNHEGTQAILKRLVERRDDVLPTFFGRRFEPDLDRFEHVGELRQGEVAALLRRCSVMLDASLEQSFGRPGIEAMACGLPSVLTTNGGINDYARNGVNCLQVDPRDVDGNVAAAERFLDDAALARQLRRAGFATAADYDAEREADRTAAVFAALLGLELDELEPTVSAVGSVTSARRHSYVS